MDPIADLLTRIRNSNIRQHDRVDVPMSKLKMEVVRVLKEEGFIANFKTYAREYGWEPGPEHIMIGMNCCVAPTYEEAKQILQSGQEYFFGVLGGGIRTAQKLVVQKTRYFKDEKTAQEQSKKFVNMRMGAAGASFDERVERGLMICGTPEMAIQQIEKVHSELGMGRLGLTITKADLGAGKGIFYRLRAGPLADEGQAKSLCRILASRKVGCLVIKPMK